MDEFSALRAAAETYRFLLRHIGVFLARGILAILAAAATVVAEFQPYLVGLAPHYADIVALLLALLTVQLGLHFAVGWHRRVLIEEAGAIEPGERLSLDLLYVRIALAVLAATLVAPVVGALAMTALGPALSIPTFLLAAIAALFVVGKLCLALPAAAVAHHRPLAIAWRLSAGIAVKLVLLLALTALPPAALAIAALAALSSGSEGQWLGGVALFAVIFTFGHAAAVGALSVAYRWRMREEGNRWWRHRAR